MNTKAFLAILFASGLAQADAIGPSVTSVTTVSDSTGRLTVTYALDAPAVVTADFVDENGVSVGLENCTSIEGDVNCYLAVAGDYSFVWNARADLQKKSGDRPASVRARLTAWSPDEPPPYLVADLSGMKPRYYADAKALPGGSDDERYKISKLLFRKIPSANVTWWMGDRKITTDDRTYPQKVRLTKNYYIGVYLTTLAQVCAARKTLDEGASTVSFKTVADWWRLPVARWTFSSIRGTKVTTAPGSWPIANADLPNDSLVKKFRNATRLDTLDLPTDAQWEFAARAGCGDAYHWGTSWSMITDYGWHSGNWADDPEVVADGNANRIHSVGLKLPNQFGLYDVIGNLREWAQDAVVKDIRTMTQYADPDDETVLVDPLGATSEQSSSVWGSRKRCQRNESYATQGHWDAMKIFWRTGESETGNYTVGFRLACPAACK